MTCAPENLVPQGPGVDPAYQGCSLAGSAVNAETVAGSAYLNTTYEYSRSNLWRNFGVVIAFTVFYILVTALATELFSFAASGGGALVFKKSKKTKAAVKSEQQPSDEEKGVEVSSSSGRSETHVGATSSGESEEAALQSLAKSDSIFTWKDVEHSVPYHGGHRKLLNGISGYAKPGKMVALVGASGAGKTTLLNTLSQRQTIGVVSGEMLVDGTKLGPSFQRGTGYCEQMDLHDGTATIREALEFSAILRQEREVPRKEKIEYVDKIIELLELEAIQDATINSLGVEQRKRLTIGVELAAKPALLLFLDEPTSGLDSNSAYSIVRFLKKLSQAGQGQLGFLSPSESHLISF
jgi:ATP-binding cassette, subfamily G (WHITE), member 2, SNQ2